jgi:hypothetical protein
MDTNQIISNFSSGELAPTMLGRADLKEKYLSAAKLLQNYVVLPQGGILKRPGTRFLAELDSTKTYTILSYTPSATTSYLLVFSEGALSVYRAEDVIDAYSDYVTTLSAPLQTFVSPYSATELPELNWAPISTEDASRVVLFAQGNHPPYELAFMENDYNPFTFSAAVFTSPPFKALDTTDTILTVSNEQWVAKLTSSNASEFSSLGTAAYVEWQKDDVWVLAKILTTATTPAAPSDPSGNVCYVQPIQNIVTGIATSARLVALDHVYDSEEIPADSLHVRSDTLVFNYSCEEAYLRVKSEYEKIRTTSSTSSAYALSETKFGDTLWVKVTSYLGPRDYPVDFIAAPAASDLVVGDTYKILRADIDMDVYAPVSGGTVEWNDSFKYNTVGDTFSLQNKFRVVTGTGELANLSKSKTFDVVETTTELSYHPCSGNIVMAADLSTLGHIATLQASKPFFAFSGSAGAEVGQYLLVKYGEKVWMLYKVSSIASATQAVVVIVDGTLPRKTSSNEIVNEGRSSTFRVSEWSVANYPRAVSWVERRLVFAGCQSAPESVWLSRVSDTYDFRTVDADGASTDDAGITYPLAGKSMNKIVNLTAGPTLAIGTQSAIWQMRKSYDGEAITPTSVTFTEETADGVYGKSLRIGSAIICVDLSRKHLIELGYSYEINGLEGQNLNLLSGHMFEQDRIVDFCFQQRPYGIIWVITESGSWYSMTYNKKQGMYSWSRHPTFGSVLGLTLLQNASDLSGYDRLVLLTSRNGHTFLELLEDFYVKEATAANKNYNFLDCTRRMVPPFAFLPPYGVDKNPPVDSPSDPLPEPKYPIGSPDFSKVYGYWEDARSILPGIKGSETMSYQWQISSDNISYTDVSGATLSYFPLPLLSPANDGHYRCKVENGLGAMTTTDAVVQCVVHPFETSLDGATGWATGMGTYERYDQRTDVSTAYNNYFLGCGRPASGEYKDGVFAWAKGVSFDAGSGTYAAFGFVSGAYGASHCSCVLENCEMPYTNLLGVSCWSPVEEVGDGAGIFPSNNTMQIKNSVVYLEGNNTPEDGYCAYIYVGFGFNSRTEEGEYVQSANNSIIFSGGSKIHSGNVRFSGRQGESGEEGAVINSQLVFTDPGTEFLMDDQHTKSFTAHASMGVLNLDPGTTLLEKGNHVDLLNACLVRLGGTKDLEGNLSQYPAILCPIFSEDAMIKLRFGGGYLAYAGDCRSGSGAAFQWKFDGSGIIKSLDMLEVRGADGIWRAAIEGDFTVTYCATDAEGLAATNNLYSGLAGYTVITAGASI